MPYPLILMPLSFLLIFLSQNIFKLYLFGNVCRRTGFPPSGVVLCRLLKRWVRRIWAQMDSVLMFFFNIRNAVSCLFWDYRVFFLILCMWNTSSHYGLFTLGYTRVIMAKTMSRDFAKSNYPLKIALVLIVFLKLRSKKLELLVIVK